MHRLHQQGSSRHVQQEGKRLLAANGDAVNADVLHPSEIVEFTTHGQFVREYNVDASQGGAFGLDTAARGSFNLAVIDDVTNSLAVTKVRD